MSHAYVRGEHDDRLGEVLVRAAAEAHAASVPPEQLLIALKSIWYSLPELTAAQPSEHATSLLQELISRCIEEYYAR